jgi:hypothetical protein
MNLRWLARRELQCNREPVQRRRSQPRHHRQRQDDFRRRDHLHRRLPYEIRHGHPHAHRREKRVSHEWRLNKAQYFLSESLASSGVGELQAHDFAAELVHLFE